MWIGVTSFVSIILGIIAGVAFILYAIKRTARLYNAAIAFLLTGIGMLALTQYLSTGEVPVILLMLVVASLGILFLGMFRKKRV